MNPYLSVCLGSSKLLDQFELAEASELALLEARSEEPVNFKTSNSFSQFDDFDVEPPKPSKNSSLSLLLFRVVKPLSRFLAPSDEERQSLQVKSREMSTFKMFRI